MRFLFYAIVVIGTGWMGHAHDIGTLTGLAGGLVLVALFEIRAPEDLVAVTFRPSWLRFPSWVVNTVGCIYAVFMLSPYVMTSAQRHQINAITSNLDSMIPVINRLYEQGLRYGIADTLPIIIAIKLGVLFLLPTFLVCAAPSLIAAIRGEFLIDDRKPKGLIALAIIGSVIPLILVDILLATSGLFFLGTQTARDGGRFQIGVIVFFCLCTNGNIFARQIAAIRHLLSQRT